MDSRHSNYTGLIASLPNLMDPFMHRHPPISRVQLFKRMNMLDYDDSQVTIELAKVFLWSEIGAGETEQAALDPPLLKRAERLIDQLEQNDIRAWLVWRMEFRSIVAALRYRHNGEDSPPKQRPWCYRSIVQLLEQNWNKADFGLSSRFHWIAQANTLLESGESAELERLLLSACWRYYQAQNPDVEYGLSHVWLYISRWDLVSRWCSYDEEKAEMIFSNLLASSVESSIQKLRESV